MLNNESKKHSDWNIWAICTLDNLISADILFLKAVPNCVYLDFVNNSSRGKLFPLKILVFILKVTPVWFLTAVFSLFSCESRHLTFNLLY